MKYPFNVEKKELKNYLFELKEVCIIEHEDNWFKENHIQSFIQILMKQS